MLRIIYHNVEKSHLRLPPCAGSQSQAPSSSQKSPIFWLSSNVFTILSSQRVYQGITASSCLFLNSTYTFKILLIYRYSLHLSVPSNASAAESRPSDLPSSSHSGAGQCVPLSSLLPASWRLGPGTWPDAGLTPWQDWEWAALCCFIGRHKIPLLLWC